MGVTPPSSGRSSPFDDPYVNGHRFADDLEGQNDEHLEGLSAKVKMLKDVSESSILYGLMMMNSSGLQSRFLSLQITIGIGNEVRESTVQLSQMVRECFSGIPRLSLWSDLLALV